MYRTVYYLGLVTFVFSLLGLALADNPSPLTFLLPTGGIAAAGLIVSLPLLHFAVASFLRRNLFKILFGVGGALLFMVAVVGVFSPTFLGLLQFYIRPANEMLLLAWGVGYFLAGLEYNRPSLMEELVLSYHKHASIIARRLSQPAKKRSASQH